MRIAYLDCFSGISGDMLLGALVDAGVPQTVLEDAVAALDLNASLRFETVDRSGISATKAHVLEHGQLAEASGDSESLRPQHRVAGHAHPHIAEEVAEQSLREFAQTQPRSLTEIRRLIDDSRLAIDVKSLAIKVFELLGRSEAKIHNVPVEEIHFHEVGAVDAIVDIVASAAGILSLKVDSWFSSPVNLGGGTVRCAHGVFPVPAPATALLLRGVPTYSAHLQKELVTPTGAALLRALEPTFGPQPAMSVDRIGYGAGTRNPAELANVLRLSIGESETASEAATSPKHPHHADGTQIVTVMETALDDATPQLLAYVTEQALRLGALDVMLTPVIMKKGRPGSLLTVLVNPEQASVFEQLILRETTALGLRIRQDRRVCLDRGHTSVETPYGTIRVKTGSLDGETLNAHPEFEDCRRAAEERSVPLKRVQAAAVAAFMKQASEERES